MSKCNCVYEEFCSMLNGSDIVLPTPCEYRKDNADFVEVVRCKDCIHFSNDTDYCREHNKGYCEFDNVIKSPTYFCSYGERKDD